MGGGGSAPPGAPDGVTEREAAVFFYGQCQCDQPALCPEEPQTLSTEKPLL